MGRLQEFARFSKAAEEPPCRSVDRFGPRSRCSLDLLGQQHVGANEGQKLQTQSNGSARVTFGSLNACRTKFHTKHTTIPASQRRYCCGGVSFDPCAGWSLHEHGVRDLL